MSSYLGFPAMLALTAVVGLLVALSRLPRVVKLLVYTALVLRVVGSIGRYYMMMVLYGGRGDALAYFDKGNHYAARFWRLDFSPFWNEELWDGTQWWGTQFIKHVSGVVLSFTGPSLLGGFLAFSMLAFLGLVGFAIAFHRSYPEVPATRYLRWVWLFPSLWFWPSSIGKEAILLLGLGLAIWGFVGQKGRVQWVLLSAGVYLVFAVRAQVAAVLILSLVLAQWLSLRGRWTVGRVVQGAVILVGGLGVIYLAMQSLGVESMDVEGVQGYMEENTGRGGEYGSTVGGVSVGIGGIPLALVNILLRPFPWEATNPQALLSALEIMGFWGIVWFRRRQVWSALRHWRSDRLLRVAIPFILMYSITLGMVLANMGIIARQRIFIFPFLFLLIEAAPQASLRWPRTPERRSGIDRSRGRATPSPVSATR